jgi:large subunit ribosomal protein L25
MSESVLQVTIRDGIGKANARRLRRSGYVPGTLYGVEKECVALSINKKELEKLLSETHSVINVKFDDNEQKSVFKEIQYHPVKGDIIHVDLQRIKAGQEISVSVPLKFIGEAPGVKMGGLFQTIKSNLDISTLPKYLPNEIEIDISSLEIGDTIHVSDLQLEHITIHLEPEELICSVILPKKVEEPVEVEEELEADEEESEEPEVISQKSKEDESEGEEG